MSLKALAKLERGLNHEEHEEHKDVRPSFVPLVSFVVIFLGPGWRPEGL
jgi:hypothetical protein